MRRGVSSTSRWFASDSPQRAPQKKSLQWARTRGISPAAPVASGIMMEGASGNLLSVSRSRAGGDVAVLAGDRFLVVDDLGDVIPESALGLYAADTRFLSMNMLHVNGERLVPLSARSI